MAQFAEMQEKLRETAASLLADGTVRLVIGYRTGTDAYRVAPVFVEQAEDADQLVLNPLCKLNLTNYLPSADGKVAVVAKGCDARSLNVLIREKQVKRENLHVLGVPCTGIVDFSKLSQLAGLDLGEFQGITRTGDEFIVQAGSEVRAQASELLRPECLSCVAPTPVVADVMLGPEVRPPEPRADASALAQLDLAVRADFFARAFERCLRCYACVAACPLCYCTVCFAQQTNPQWVPRTHGLHENGMFHLGRAMHLAGRCVDCGTCDSVCPVQIPLRELNSRMAEEARQLFGYTAGMDPDELPPFITFRPDDTEEAIDGARSP
jgi:ferredoxin